jgi:hypothetical protein
VLRTLRFILSQLWLILLVNPVFGQTAEATGTGEAPGTGMRVRGPRISIDLASLSLLYFDQDRMVYTVSVDYEIAQDIYPVLDLGYQTVKINRDNYDYLSNGFFFRAGADVNFLKYEGTHVYEMLYGGIRYGFSNFMQKADNISVPDDYFTGLNGASLPDRRLNAHWISVVGGLRVGLLDNFFMGWSVLGNIKLSLSDDPSMVPYNIPGFGKGERRAAIVINYTIGYRIPTETYKPRKIIKVKEQSQESESTPLEEQDSEFPPG